MRLRLKQLALLLVPLNALCCRAWYTDNTILAVPLAQRRPHSLRIVAR